MKAITLFNEFIQKDEPSTLIINSEVHQDKFITLFIRLSEDRGTWTLLVSYKKITNGEPCVEKESWYFFNGDQVEKVQNFLLSFNGMYEVKNKQQMESIFLSDLFNSQEKK